MRRLLSLVVCLCVIQATSTIVRADSCPLYPMGFQGGFVTYYALRSSPACQQPHMYMGPFGLTSNCSDGTNCLPSLKEKPLAKPTRYSGEKGSDPDLAAGVSDIEVPETTVWHSGWIKKVKTSLVFFKLTQEGTPIYLQLHWVKSDPANYDFPGLNDDSKKAIKNAGRKPFFFGHEVEPVHGEDYEEITDPRAIQVIEEGFQYRIKYQGQTYSAVIQKR